jgi:arsenate reductase (thioredoxin)
MNRPLSVLFLCTHNSARSILAEALLNQLGRGRFIGHSAGSTPRDTGQPNPLALTTLADADISTAGLRSKSWNEFLGPDAPPIDLVITVCGNAEQACPHFPGAVGRVHWGYEDPSAGEAADEIKAVAFRTTLHQMRRRLEAFTQLPDAALERLQLADSARRLVSI